MASAVWSFVWPLLSSYRPNWASYKQKDAKAARFGAFTATYFPPVVHRAPKNNREAQRMYNHIRTVAFYLDAIPVAADSNLPFNSKFGLDDLISSIPIWGDLVSGSSQSYQVFSCWVFGVPTYLSMRMVSNVIIDVLVGIVPFVGDSLDNLFKSNSKNSNSLESWLSGNNKYQILLMPDNTWMPRPKSNGSWFGMGGSSKRKAQEHRSGRVNKTRRMTKAEANWSWEHVEEAGDNAYYKAEARVDEEL